MFPASISLYSTDLRLAHAVIGSNVPVLSVVSANCGDLLPGELCAAIGFTSGLSASKDHIPGVLGIGAKLKVGGVNTTSVVATVHDNFVGGNRSTRSQRPGNSVSPARGSLGAYKETPISVLDSARPNPTPACLPYLAPVARKVFLFNHLPNSGG